MKLSNTRTLNKTFRLSNSVTHDVVQYKHNYGFKMPEEVKVQQLEYQRWLSELRQCIGYLQDPQFESVDKSKEIKQLTQFWLDNYFELNLEENNVSRQDMLFYVRCFLVVCHRGNLEKQPLEQLLDLFNRVAMFSCNHNCAAHMKYPAKEEIEKLENDCFHFIVQHYFSKNDMQVTSEKMMDAKFNELSPDLKTLKAQLHVVDETKPSAAVGWLWLNEPLRMYLTFIPLCSRVFQQVYREQALLDLYPVEPIPDIHAHCVQRLQQWLAKEASIDAEDDLRPRYSELVHEMQIPAGGRLQSQRRLVTRDDQPNSQTIIERELGFDTALKLSDAVNCTKPIDVSKNPEHEHYSCLLLTMFDLRMKQTKKTEFIKNYVILPTGLPNLNVLPKYKKPSTETYQGQARAPLILYLKRTWMIQYKRKLFECASLEECLLGWLRLCSTQYEGYIPHTCDIDISDWYKQMFGL
jgi:hypothetical protein